MRDDSLIKIILDKDIIRGESSVKILIVKVIMI